jgi:hypothetical protein
MSQPDSSARKACVALWGVLDKLASMNKPDTVKALCEANGYAISHGSKEFSKEAKKARKTEAVLREWWPGRDKCDWCQYVEAAKGVEVAMEGRGKDCHCDIPMPTEVRV